MSLLITEYTKVYKNLCYTFRICCARLPLAADRRDDSVRRLLRRRPI